jgi:hypothetical protein
MRSRRFLQWGFAAGLTLACAAPRQDTVSVPPCPGPDLRAPAVDPAECGERELADYTAALTDRMVDPHSRALVRVEFDDKARVRSVCLDERTGHDTWNARRDLLERLTAMRTIPSGPQCVAGRRIDLNLYEAKLAETRDAQNWCRALTIGRMKALHDCEKFDPDWILYDRIGATRPYLYVKSDGVQASATETLIRCSRTTTGFEKQSQCIEADGFQLVTPSED